MCYQRQPTKRTRKKLSLKLNAPKNSRAENGGDENRISVTPNVWVTQGSGSDEHDVYRMLSKFYYFA